MKPTGKTTFNYCKICKKCCNEIGISTIILSKYDIKRLRKAGKKFKFVKDGAVFRMKLEKGKCKFLESKGCTLPEKIKPLDCKIFPVLFHFLGKNNYYFTVSLHCPYWNKISKAYIKNAKKIALKELKHWTKKEQIGYWL